MAYINHDFLHDIFFSYAHGRAQDNGTERLKYWSETLRNELYGEIIDLLPEFNNLDIFIDNQLDPTQPLTDAIRKEVKGSGLLLILMSNHYLQSVWCKAEREWFETEVQRRSQEGGVVLVIRVQPTPHEDWPRCLKDERGHVVIGFKFHPNQKDKDELTPPYGWPKPLHEDRLYYEQLGKLASIVTKRLRKIKIDEELRIKAQTPRASVCIQSKPNIYLLAPNDSREEWNIVREKLIAIGYCVLPEILPNTGSDLTKIHSFRKTRLKTLKDAADALFFLWPASTNDIEREIETMVSDRNALQVFDKDIPCAVLNCCNSNYTLTNIYGIEIIQAYGDNLIPNVQNWLKRVLDIGQSR